MDGPGLRTADELSNTTKPEAKGDYQMSEQRSTHVYDEWLSKRLTDRQWEDVSKSWAQDLARQYKSENGGFIQEHVDPIRSAAQLIINKRRKRREWQRANRSESPSVDERFERMTRRLFDPNVFNVRTATNQHSDHVIIVAEGSGVMATSETECVGWYRGSMRDWRKYGSIHTYYVPLKWCTRVYSKGLSILDSMPTLDAQVEETRNNVTVYKAIWVRQGRGTQLCTEQGWIATDGELHYHSTKSSRAARSGLSRKRTYQAKPSLREQASERMLQRWAVKRAQTQRRIEKLVKQMQKGDLAEFSDIDVTVDDSHKAGNCESGTTDFICRIFGDYREQASIGEIVEAIGHRSQNIQDWAEANVETARQLVAACLVAIRRQKRIAKHDASIAVALAASADSSLNLHLSRADSDPWRNV